MYKIVPVSPTCTLTTLFEDPCNRQLPLLTRILSVVFHILTLGIPLAIYQIIACCCPRDKALEQAQQLQALRQQAIESVEATKPRICSSALSTAVLLSNGSKIDANYAGLKDPRLAMALSMLDNVYLPQLQEFIAEQKENLWKEDCRDDLLTILSRCFCLTYAVGKWMLEEIALLSQTPNDPGQGPYANQSTWRKTIRQWTGKPLINPTPDTDRNPDSVVHRAALLLTTQNNPYWLIFYRLPELYRFVRLARTHGEMDTETLGQLNDPSNVEESWSQQFYEENERTSTDLTFAQMRALFNHYAQAVAAYIPQDVLHAADTRFTGWIEPDLNAQEWEQSFFT